MAVCMDKGGWWPASNSRQAEAQRALALLPGLFRFERCRLFLEVITRWARLHPLQRGPIVLDFRRPVSVKSSAEEFALSLQWNPCFSARSGCLVRSDAFGKAGQTSAG